MKLRSWLSMCAAVGMTALGIAGLYSRPHHSPGLLVSESDASQLIGGASDAYYRNPSAGCGAYSKLGPGGVTFRCAFGPSITATYWFLGTWGSPGATGTCTQCGDNCGTTQTIAGPSQG